LRPFPEKVADIAERAGKDKTELGETLYGMSRRGLIQRYKAPDDELYYFLVPWVVGIYEFQLNNLTPENIKLYEKYYEEGMVPARQNRKIGLFRVIPESQTKFAVADCICRKEARMLGKGCDKLLEACLSFGAFADFYIENGLGREISKEEAKKILLKAEEDGLIHCSTNSAGNKLFICNCCGCCCKYLALVTKYGNLQAIARSNYYATKDQETCTDCGTCVERCQVNAVRSENDHTVIDSVPQGQSPWFKNHLRKPLPFSPVVKHCCRQWEGKRVRYILSNRIRDLLRIDWSRIPPLVIWLRRRRRSRAKIQSIPEMACRLPDGDYVTIIFK